jgi:hypothetical protein
LILGQGITLLLLQLLDIGVHFETTRH